MNTIATPTSAAPSTGVIPRLTALLQGIYRLMGALPKSMLAFIARFSIAAVFWKSGQTKIEGFAIDIVNREFTLELPLLPPEIGAAMAAFGERFFPILLLLGLATRLAALALLGLTMVIQLFVYPDAYPTHGVWAAVLRYCGTAVLLYCCTAVLLYIMADGPGKLSIDAWIARPHQD